MNFEINRKYLLECLSIEYGDIVDYRFDEDGDIEIKKYHHIEMDKYILEWEEVNFDFNKYVVYSRNKKIEEIGIF